MITSHVVFNEVSIRGEKRFKCACGRRLLRRRRFYQTLNPFNKYKGEPKTKDRIFAEIQVECLKWLAEINPCTHTTPATGRNI